tara:strand:- start:4391 stop:5407 length:1017 start_codon:yes stop_codon:yes gene_type:complete
MNITHSSSAYNDLQGLQSIKQLAGQDESAALIEVAAEFESLLVNMMLKNMRSATNALAKDSLLGGDQVSFYQGMLDDQWSIELTGNNGLGFADAIVRQLGPKINSIIETPSVSNESLPIGSATQDSRSLQSLDDTLFSIHKLKQDHQQTVATPTTAAHNSAATHFSSPKDFIASLYPYAEKAASKLGVSPSVLLAQAGLETGWGQHIPLNQKGGQSFNLFGIKADDRWSGSAVAATTTEYDGIKKSAVEVECSFRAYQSFEDSFKDYADFIIQHPRYQIALEKADNKADFADELQHAGYATDPEYANKIKAILLQTHFNIEVNRAENLSGDTVFLSKS